MSKRILSLLLVLSLLLPCICACSDNDREKKKPSSREDSTTASTGSLSNTTDDGADSSQGALTVEIEEDLGITDELINTLSNSLVLLLNSSNSCSKGEISSIEENTAPLLIDDILYLPAAFVAKSFGSNTDWNPETQMLTARWDDHSLTICASDEHIVVDGENIPLPTSSVIENNVLLTPAKPLCDGLGQTVEQVNDLIIIGSGLSEASKGVPEESLQLMYTSLAAKLATVQGLVFDGAQQKTYEDWVNCTKSIVIDPTLAPWSSPRDELAAVTGSLYIENISITPAAQNTYDCTMDVHNYLGYTYGAVEVYNADNDLIEIERIKPFTGQKASVVSAVCNVAVLGGDLQKTVQHWDLDYMNYKSTLNSAIQTVSINVPVDGYAIITANPIHSDHVAVYNMVHTLVEVMFAANDLKVSDDDNRIKALIKDHIIEELGKNATLLPEIATEFRIFLSSISDNDWSNGKVFVQSSCNSLLDILNRVEFDFWGTVRNAIMEAGHEVTDFLAEEFIGHMVPGADNALAFWKICTNVTNLACLFMDLSVISKTESLMLECFNWRKAYAQILRDFPTVDVQGRLTFTTGYVNGDMVPELIIIDAVAHFGNTMYMYTYQDRNIVPVLNSAGNAEFSVPNAMFTYVEVQGIMTRGDMNRGYVSVIYDQLQEAQFQPIHTFHDNESAVSNGPDAHYTYNDSKVMRWYYYWKQECLDKKYKDSTVRVDGFSIDEVTEANIQKHFES